MPYHVKLHEYRSVYVNSRANFKVLRSPCIHIKQKTHKRASRNEKTCNNNVQCVSVIEGKYDPQQRIKGTA